MIVWGGTIDGNPGLDTGGRYDPGTNMWTATSTTNAPSGRMIHTAIWTGSEMIVWGGEGAGPVFRMPLNTGRRYDPTTDSWMATSTTNAPSARFLHTSVWTGSEMIVWGGWTNTGGRYCAQPRPTPTPTPTPTATFTPTPTATPRELEAYITVSKKSVRKGHKAAFILAVDGVARQPITMQYSMTGTAVLGSDYTLSGIPGEVTILAGESSARVILRALKNRNKKATMNLIDGPGYFVLDLPFHNKISIKIKKK
jgi:hypothetical protein